MKPIFTYYGGKQRLAPKIINEFPDHKSYIEPFCGSSAVYFSIENPVEINVLNDKNELIINFYKIVKTKLDEFTEKLDVILHSEYYYQQSKIMMISSDDVERALGFYINISLSFASKLNGGYGYSKNSSNGAPKNFTQKKKYIKDKAKLLEFAHITNTDAISCIERFDSETALFYLDPPYPNTHQGHYNGYTQEDFEKLLLTLNQIKGKFILSCYDNESFNPDWIKKNVSISQITSKNKHTKTQGEVLVMNFGKNKNNRLI